MSNTTSKFQDVLREELEVIARSRREHHPADGTEHPERNLFGIALSGGGIRSATISLGLLNVLNDCGILSRADYLSSVSGGGYAGAYVHAKLHESGDFTQLFEKNDIDHLRSFGYYLAPGRKWWRLVNRLRLAGAFVASLFMNWLWVILLFLSLALATRVIGKSIFSDHTRVSLLYVLGACLVVLMYHYFFHTLRYVRLWSSNVLNYTEGVLLVAVLLLLAFLGSEKDVPVLIKNLKSLVLGVQPVSGFPQLSEPSFQLLIVLVLFALSGLFANPNILTMHRFYRDRLAKTYLSVAGKQRTRMYLRDLASPGGNPGILRGPYPLINTCLNILGSGQHKGQQTSDYFLLSPLYCGSKLTGFIETRDSYYKRMTLATAVAVSGAALNPGMGAKTNKIASFFMTLFNLQLGFWTMNPRTRVSVPLTWWPYYDILQLLSMTNANRRRVNISDGGHIENLGVYELLRRECKLIIAIDAGADPTYRFADLNNLVMRALNELGVVITFRPGFQPEDVIRPKPSAGFSRSHFAIADIRELAGKGKRPPYTGVLVYVKSSMRAPAEWHEMLTTDEEYESFQYKTYHSAFPHESTADQFFDSDQWNAYYTLGKYIAGDLLNIDIRDAARFRSRALEIGKMGINELSGYFSALGSGSATTSTSQ